ncbi:hypothetical protein [Acetobacter orientalis]|nr:hypothetical protein [Acetobacter orientalis]GAN66681.1 hypothetical protein Abor_024_125 [Acetobacter orientalis]GBR13621.1 hypothetical protein AA0481_0401 [Acetobacter orientalis NRIC 0481]GEL60679.1 hypothetical protein AOR02nite_05210 [Acetobacter orientalis]
MFRAVCHKSCRPTLLAAFSALLLATVYTHVAFAGTFSVTDAKAETEISEVSRVYIDGKLAAIFKLDDKTREKTIKITTPVGRIDHTYTLCGEITIRTPEGRVETHEVSNDGLLHNPDNRRLYALGSNNFTEFFLLDPEAPSVAEHYPTHSNVCSMPVS